jgi:long-subunit fatty acid transport protein
LTQELDEVLNYGVGVEYAFRERLTFYSSFATDFSAVVPGTETNLSMSNVDVYNFALGAAFAVARWELTLGAAYAFGDEKFGKALNFQQIPPDNPVAEKLRNANLSYQRIKLLFGFSYKL